MNNNAPTGAWTPQHQDLYDALIAERTLPHFCRRISQEHTTIDRAQARNWRNWAHNLTNDPGWIHVESVLERPDAWPKTWKSLPPDAWSPQTDHFNALFFASLIPGALVKNNIDHALYAFQEAIAAWNRSLSSRNTPVFPDLHPIFNLLDHYPFRIQDLEQLFHPGLDSAHSDNEKLAKFVWQALNHVQSTPLCEALKPFSEHAHALLGTLLEGIYANVIEFTTTIDLSTAQPKQIHQIFTTLSDFHRRITPPAEQYYPIYEFAVVQAATSLASELSLANSDLDPDTRATILQPVLQSTQSFNHVLFEHLQANPSIPSDFHEACAEFFVLHGDLQNNATQRLASFEQALRIAPENQRARIRAAQTCLERANILLLFTAPVPGFASQIPGGQRVITRVEQARDLYFRACALNPANDLLPTYQTEIALECKRFDIPFEQKPGSQP